jgi:hypothetical protein
VKQFALHGFFNLVVRGDFFVVIAFIKVPYLEVIIVVEGHIVKLAPEGFDGVQL